MILLLIQILFNLHDVSGLKDAECCSLTYVDPNRTELGNDNVLPFQLSKLFSHNRLILLSKIVSIVFYRYVTGDENTWAFAVCGDIDNSWLEIEDIMAAKHAHNR